MAVCEVDRPPPRFATAYITIFCVKRIVFWDSSREPTPGAQRHPAIFPIDAVMTGGILPTVIDRMTFSRSLADERCRHVAARGRPRAEAWRSDREKVASFVGRVGEPKRLMVNAAEAIFRESLAMHPMTEFNIALSVISLVSWPLLWRMHPAAEQGGIFRFHPFTAGSAFVVIVNWALIALG